MIITMKAEEVMVALEMYLEQRLLKEGIEVQVEKFGFSNRNDVANYSEWVDVWVLRRPRVVQPPAPDLTKTGQRQIDLEDEPKGEIPF